MFFIGVFGIENKQKEIKKVISVVCKECNDGELTLYKEYSMFHFFFIPIIKWGVKYYLMCSKCNTVYELSKERGEAVEESSHEITYWDLKKLYRGEIKVYCHNCSREVDEKFQYCPYCGSKI
ncbi:MAG: zinc ribbon domain-containing protein [Clostridiaceae bacterium]